MFTNRRFRYLVAILYLLFISFLFFLPGAAFPKDNWMDKIWFDKWVHIGLFAMLVLLWCRAGGTIQLVRIWIVAAALYGICVELVQHNFIANRGFQISDWIADVAGIAAGYFFWKRYVKK